MPHVIRKTTNAEKLPFQVRLIVSLTTLLVLYTLFNNTSSTLPVTAYVKMVDVWFFHCIFTLFFIIVSHVLVEHLDTNNESETTKVQPLGVRAAWSSGIKPEQVLRILRRYLLPIEALLFNIVYWTVLHSQPAL